MFGGSLFALHSPLPTGKYGVIRKTYIFEDESRCDPHNFEFPRRLALDLWLPVDQELKLVAYDERALQFWKQANFWSKDQRLILENALTEFGEYLSKDKQLNRDSNPLPVVIFSHGFGAWASFYSYLLAEIVSHGIAVVGINHTYNAGIAQFPEQTIYCQMTHAELFKSKYAKDEQLLWIQDVENTIKEIESSSFPAALDPQKIVVMGHSFGGSTAIHACCKIPGLKGCINLDGALFGAEELTTTLSPLLILLGSDSIKFMEDRDSIEKLATQLEITAEQADDFRNCYLDRLMQIAKKNDNVHMAILADINHVGFTDFCFLSQSPLFNGMAIGSKPSNEIVAEIRRNVIHFLHKAID